MNYIALAIVHSWGMNEQNQRQPRFCQATLWDPCRLAHAPANRPERHTLSLFVYLSLSLSLSVSMSISYIHK